MQRFRILLAGVVALSLLVGFFEVGRQLFRDLPTTGKARAVLKRIAVRHYEDWGFVRHLAAINLEKPDEASPEAGARAPGGGEQRSPREPRTGEKAAGRVFVFPDIPIGSGRALLRNAAIVDSVTTANSAAKRRPPARAAVGPVLAR